jgi:hypothetical protein
VVYEGTMMRTEGGTLHKHGELGTMAYSSGEQYSGSWADDKVGIPLQNWRFTPELPWQSRGKWRIFQGHYMNTCKVSVCK